MNQVLSSFLRLFARILFAALFIISGLSKFLEPEMTEKFIASHGLSAAVFLTYAAACIEVIGGFFLLIGFIPRTTAFILFVYLVIVTVTMHTFWMGSDTEMALQFVEFLKNLGILAGLLYVMATGGGSWGVSGDTSVRKSQTVHRK